MAHYTVKHRCTHEQIVQLFGKGDDRRRRIAAMERDLCPACAAAEAQREAAANGWARLEGSPKQQSWAGEIRAGLIQQAEAQLRRARDNADALTDPAQQEKAAALLARGHEQLERYAAISSARWIIDHRGLTALNLLNGYF